MKMKLYWDAGTFSGQLVGWTNQASDTPLPIYCRLDFTLALQIGLHMVHITSMPHTPSANVLRALQMSRFYFTSAHHTALYLNRNQALNTPGGHFIVLCALVALSNFTAWDGWM